MANKTRTYYVHLDDDGKAIGPRAHLEGKNTYGYRNMRAAVRYAPDGANIQERHTDGVDDWAGRIVATMPKAS